jgi:UDP:flavonoid glycosyltransferase YjiC (YdhE family)
MPNLAMNFAFAITQYMAHFGVICPELSGHLNPQTALARELMARGHRVSFYQRPYSQARLQSTGFVCRSYANDEFPVQRMAEQDRTLAQLGGRKALQYTIAIFKESTDVCLRQVPNLLTNDGVDALLVDQVSWAGATIAEHSAQSPRPARRSQSN